MGERTVVASEPARDGVPVAARPLAATLAPGRPLTPLRLAALQRAVGNRAACRLLQRTVREVGTPGSRPAIDINDSGPGVRLLQSLLIKYVSKNAWPLPLSGVMDSDTLVAIQRFDDQYGSGTSVVNVWATIDEMERVAAQAVPKEKTFDDRTPEHKADVAALVNRHLAQAYSNAHLPEATPVTVRDYLIDARNSVTAERNAPGRLTLNITLRDAQRYLYGRLAPYTDAVELKKWAGAGLETSTHDAVFRNPPSDVNVRGTILATEEYEHLKSQRDVRTSDKPASALGGIDFFNKGIADSDRDRAGDAWSKDLAPGRMDTSDIGERCPAEGKGAFPCTGAAGSEDG